MGRLTTIGPKLNSLTAGVEFDAIVNSPTIASSTALGNTTAIRCVASVANTAHGVQILPTNSARADLYMRFNLSIATLPNQDTSIFVFSNGLSDSFQVVLRTTGALALYNTTTQVGSDSAPLAVGGANCIEGHVNTSAASGSNVMELRIDGVSIASSSTLVQANQLVNVRLGVNHGNNFRTATAGDLYISDIAINDTTGSIQNSFPGPGKTVYLFPTAAGDNAIWTIGGSAPAATNWQSTNEAPPDDGTTLVTKAATGSKIDDYKVAPTNVGLVSTDVITLVHVAVRAGSNSASAAGGRRLWTRLKSAASGTTVISNGAGVAATTTGVTTVIPVNTTTFVTNTVATPSFPQLVAYVDPTTGVAWTVTGTNSLTNAQIGFQNEVSSANTINVTTVWAIVDYVRALPTPTVPRSQAPPRAANW